MRRRQRGPAVLSSIVAAVLSTAGHTVPSQSARAESRPTESVPTDASCLPRATRADRTAVLTGRTDDGADWMTAFGIDDRGIQMVCVDITVDGETVVDGRIGGPFVAGTEPTEVVVAFMNAGRAEGARWYVVRGTVPAAAARLELSFDRSDPVEAQIATVGPEDGWRWYAAVVPHSGSRNPEVVAVAYDPEDEPVAMGVDVFHDADTRLQDRSR